MMKLNLSREDGSPALKHEEIVALWVKSLCISTSSVDGAVA